MSTSEREEKKTKIGDRKEEVARRREAILKASRDREQQRAQALREKNKKLNELDDLLSLVLQHWAFSALLHYMQRFFLRVLDYQDPLNFLASQFAEVTLLECSADREVSFRLYCHEVCRAAAAAAAAGAEAIDESADPCKQHYMMLMRSLFLIALQYDTRIQQLVMGRHAINYEHVRCKPPGRLKTNAFLEAIKPQMDTFLCRQVSLPVFYSGALERWTSDQFMLRRFAEQPFRYLSVSADATAPAHPHNKEQEEGNIPHSGHPQISSTASHTGCDLSLIDELGF
jgi:hypothetical protein